MQKPVVKQPVTSCFLAIFKSQSSTAARMPRTSLASLFGHESFCFAHRLQLLLLLRSLSHHQNLVVVDVKATCTHTFVVIAGSLWPSGCAAKDTSEHT